MLSNICCSALLAWISITFAQTDTVARLKERHDREDQFWARKNGLSANDIRAIRMLAGISDRSNGEVIKNIDANSLQQHNHILLVETGNGHCMRLHVFERTLTAFKEIWSLSEMPGRNWPIGEIGNLPGGGICRQGPRDPSGHATTDGRIVVEVPVLSHIGQRTLPVSTYSFRWDGSKYIPLDDDR